MKRMVQLVSWICLFCFFGCSEQTSQNASTESPNEAYPVPRPSPRKEMAPDEAQAAIRSVSSPQAAWFEGKEEGMMEGLVEARRGERQMSAEELDMLFKEAKGEATQIYNSRHRDAPAESNQDRAGQWSEGYKVGYAEGFKYEQSHKQEPKTPEHESAAAWVEGKRDGRLQGIADAKADSSNPQGRSQLESARRRAAGIYERQSGRTADAEWLDKYAEGYEAAYNDGFKGAR